jgi:hypothetical protein
LDHKESSDSTLLFMQQWVDLLVLDGSMGDEELIIA